MDIFVNYVVETLVNWVKGGRQFNAMDINSNHAAQNRTEWWRLYEDEESWRVSLSDNDRHIIIFVAL